MRAILITEDKSKNKTVVISNDPNVYFHKYLAKYFYITYDSNMDNDLRDLQFNSIERTWSCSGLSGTYEYVNIITV